MSKDLKMRWRRLGKLWLRKYQLLTRLMKLITLSARMMNQILKKEELRKIITLLTKTIKNLKRFLFVDTTYRERVNTVEWVKIANSDTPWYALNMPGMVIGEADVRRKIVPISTQRCVISPLKIENAARGIVNIFIWTVLKISLSRWSTLMHHNRQCLPTRGQDAPMPALWQEICHKLIGKCSLQIFVYQPKITTRTIFQAVPTWEVLRILSWWTSGVYD